MSYTKYLIMECSHSMDNEQSVGNPSPTNLCTHVAQNSICKHSHLKFCDLSFENLQNKKSAIIIKSTDSTLKRNMKNCWKLTLAASLQGPDSRYLRIKKCSSEKENRNFEQPIEVDGIMNKNFNAQFSTGM